MDLPLDAAGVLYARAGNAESGCNDVSKTQSSIRLTRRVRRREQPLEGPGSGRGLR
jgi:hypothetical protein